jgi:hypothetical protein
VQSGDNMDNLKQVMIDRAATQSGHTPPPNGNSASQWDRWSGAQKMIDGFQNGWQPNPVLTNLLEKK